MSLVEDKIDLSVDTDLAEAQAAAAALEKWLYFPASTISHHGKACCEIAREWFIATDFSQLNGGNPLTGPRWLRQKYAWGASHWAMYWCEAMREKTLDCGALAALAQTLFTARGVRSFPAQFIQQYNAHATCHWLKSWEESGATNSGSNNLEVHWIEDDLIYHEGCAVVVRGNEIKFWDATASWWMNPRQYGGYGGLLAARLFSTPDDSPSELVWGAHRIVPNQWNKIERVGIDFK